MHMSNFIVKDISLLSELIDPGVAMGQRVGSQPATARPNCPLACLGALLCPFRGFGRVANDVKFTIEAIAAIPLGLVS
jgi:hypothetical protein